MKKVYGYFLIAVASVIWGTMGIFGKQAFEYGINPATLIALRLLVSSLAILTPITLFKRELFKIQKKDLPKFLILGILATVIQRVTYFYAINLTTATIAAVLFYTYPLFVTICASVFFKEKVTFSIILAIILTFSGAALVVKAYQTSWLNANLLGVIFGFLSSIFFVFYFFIVKELRNRYTNWTLSLYGDTIGAIALAPIVFSSLPEIVGYPQQLWFLILAIGLFSSLLAYLLYSYALKHVASAKGSILSVIEPLSAAILSVAILKENLETLQILGVALASIGVILLFYKPKIQK